MSNSLDPYSDPPFGLIPFTTSRRAPRIVAPECGGSPCHGIAVGRRRDSAPGRAGLDPCGGEELGAMMAVWLGGWGAEWNGRVDMEPPRCQASLRRAESSLSTPGGGLAGLPTRKSLISTCFFLMNLWEEMGGGMARIELFDPRLNAGAYLTKDLARLGNASLSRGFHETGKFSWGDCTLTIANSVPPSPSGLRRGRLEGCCQSTAPPRQDPRPAIGSASKQGRASTRCT